MPRPTLSVSFTDNAEPERLRRSFLKKTLGLGQTDAVYHLLTGTFGKLSGFAKKRREA